MDGIELAYTLNSTGEVLTLKDVRTMFLNEDTTKITPGLEYSVNTNALNLTHDVVYARQGNIYYQTD